MRPALVQRQLILVAVTVLAIAISLAVTTRPGHKAAAAIPAPVGSYTALVAESSARSGKKTACGVLVAAWTMGISSPVLPCGVRIYLSHGGRHVLASVIGRGPSGPGAEFAITPALARRLGITGLRRVHWSYAASG